MTLEKKIRNQFALYNSGRLDMKEFRHWFAPFLRDVHKTGDADLEKFAHAVEWEFLDYERGLVSEPELKQELARLVGSQFLTPESVEIVVEGFYFPIDQPKIKLTNGVVQVSSVFVRGAESAVSTPSSTESSSDSIFDFTFTAAPA